MTPALVDQRVALGDAQLYVHVRITADGRIALRSTAGGTPPTWTAQADYPFTVDDPEASMKAIKRLHGGLTTRFLTQDQESDPLAEASGPPAVVIIDAEPATRWRYVQWTIATASSLEGSVARVCFFVPGGGRWIDVELPSGEEQHPANSSLRMVTVLTAKLFRNELEHPSEQHFTRIRWERTQQEVTPTLDPRIPDRDRADSERVVPDSAELPRAAEGPEAHAAAWQKVEDQVASLVRGRSPWIGELKAPFPKGLFVPYGDATAMLEILQRQGCRRIWLEGAPPPTLRKGGGWDFEGGR